MRLLSALLVDNIIIYDIVLVMEIIIGLLLLFLLPLLAIGAFWYGVGIAGILLILVGRDHPGVVMALVFGIVAFGVIHWWLEQEGIIKQPEPRQAGPTDQELHDSYYPY